MLTSDSSRTYGSDAGEDIRQGFEPNDSSAVVDPKAGDQENFAIGEDDGDGESPGDQESREWKDAKVQEPVLKLTPKYGLPGEDLSNIWAGDEPSGPARENP